MKLINLIYECKYGMQTIKRLNSRIKHRKRPITFFLEKFLSNRLSHFTYATEKLIIKKNEFLSVFLLFSFNKTVLF